MNFELYIEGYKADVSADLPAMLNFAIDDVKDFASRSTTWSKTIVLPGTANNNRLFGNIFDFNTQNTTDDDLININYNFNASRSASVIVLQNNMQCMKGTLRLISIINDEGRYEYEVAVFGTLNQFVSYISANLLEDLDFSEYNSTYDTGSIITSWNRYNSGSGIYYPLIDYGTYSTDKHNWDVYTFRPALFVKEYIDKIFEASGFSYSSSLFDSTRFKSIVIPHNRKKLTKLSNAAFDGNTTTDKLLIDTAEDIFIALDYDSYSGIFEPVGTSTSLYEYIGEDTATFDMTVNISGEYYSTAPIYMQFTIIGKTPVTLKILPANGTTQPFNITYTSPVTFNNGDKWSIGPFVASIFNATLTVHSAKVSFGSSGALDIPINIGDTVIINDTIPKNIRQIEFIQSIIKLWNLYIWEDKFDEKKLYIEPYIDFYDINPKHAIDWTYKLDRNSPITIKLLSELSSRYYAFKNKEDSDYYNDLYKKRYNETYGSRTYDSEYQFGSNSGSIDVIFSGTPLVGYDGEEKIYSTIFKKSDSKEETIDSNIRILQAYKVNDVTSWNITSDSGSNTLVSLTDYGYAGHLNNPDAPTTDLNYGVPAEFFFELTAGDLTANQFNVYYSAYMAEITNQNSKLISGKFRLNPMDIFNLDFSKPIYIDGSLFKLNKISDYNAASEDTCKAELLNIINLTY